LRGNFLLLSISSFLFVMSLYLMVPMLPVYLGDMGAAEAEIGLIIGFAPLAMVFTRIPVGRFIDRHERRWVLLFGILLQATAPFLYTLCTDTTQFMAVRALNGIGLAAYVVTAQTMVVDLSPKGRLGEVLGIYFMCFLSAQAVGPSISGLVLSSMGYTATFYASGLVGLTAVALALSIRVPPRPPSEEKPVGFSTVIKNRNLVTGSLAMAIVMMPHGVVTSFIPLYAAGLDIGPQGIGLFFTVYAIGTGVVRPFMGALSDRVGRAVVAVPFMLFTALGTACFAFAGDLAGLLAVGALLGISIGAAGSAISALSVDTMKPELRGQAVAVGGMCMDTGTSGGAIGMGSVVSQVGYYPAFGSAAVVVLAGTAAFLGFRKWWKKEEKIYT